MRRESDRYGVGAGVLLALPLLLVAVHSAGAQGGQSLKTPGIGGSSNVHVQGHLPLGNWSQVMDLEVEQELSRPYAFVSRADFLPLCNRMVPNCPTWQEHGASSKGVDIISI